MSTARPRAHTTLVFVAVLTVGCALSGCAIGTPPTAGAVVVSCDRAEAADIAGLVPGDVIVEWRQGQHGGPIESPYQLAVVEQDASPLGPVKLTIRRGWRTRRIVIPTGRWRVHLRPVLDRESLTEHLEAASLADGGDLDEAVARWEGLAADAIERQRMLEASWLTMQAGIALATNDRRDEFMAALGNGAEMIDEPRVRAAYWERAGDELHDAGRRPYAAYSFRSALEILEPSEPDSTAWAFTQLQFCRTDLRRCGAEASRVLEIYTSIAPGTVEEAHAISLMGSTAFFQSRFDDAEQAYAAALEVVEANALGQPIECELLGNLGLVAMRRGDLNGARRFFQREVQIAEAMGTDTAQYSHAANYLGLLAKNMGRYERARLHYEQALRSFQQLYPDGVEVAGVLTNLGNVAFLEGNLDAAGRYHGEALRVRRQLADENADVAASLHSVGLVTRLRGDLKDALLNLEQSLEIKQEIAPGTVWTANTLFELGEVMRFEGDLDKAEDYHRRALEIRRRVEPGHRDIASSLYAIGMVERERGRPDAAESLWREAVSIIERSRREIGASVEVRSRYGARYSMLYHQLARLLVEQDREAEAWDLLEEVRARALRTTIAGRESIPEGVPSELWFAKTRSENSIDRLEGRLARMDPVDDEANIRRYRERLNAAQRELDTIVRAIGEAAPRYASFSTPESVTLEETVRALDAGTAVISYSFGDEEGMALVLAPAGDPADRLRAFHIPLGAKELSSRVNILHALIARGKTVGKIEDAYIAQARRFFQLLVEPAMDAVSTAERILIIPDGPLVDIPFGALVVPGPEARFFGHWKPLFFNPSVSVHVQLGRSEQRSKEGPPTVVAFGDADYTPGTPLVDRYRLQPLPGTRTEIRSIESVFGSRASSYLGSAATEANFRKDSGQADVVHCAVHAVTDDRFPMDSALFFSDPGGPGQRTDDGVLWAWEIADELEIGADVVVLSACDTGRGQVVAGEGVIGLARAFQYAGARTLVSAQWKIPDESTARLMGRFYAGLKQGMSTVDALRLAQLETSMNDSATAHPYHWASFQVRGDWR